ncbi:MAG: hypothetical protein DSM106950_01645 [Stigonema ocellatum SAG 48.90 = DSM 106950]|nr:hypothetical protein [Stigonema ocellatum SAG 48.90 = DSM 106950]
MNLRIKRRRFGQIVIASATTTVIASLAGKSMAQQTQQIYGISLPSINPATNRTTGSVSLSSNVENAVPAIVLKSLDLSTGKESSNQLPASPVENVTTLLQSATKAIFTDLGEQVKGLTAKSDGTLISATVTSSPQGDVNQLTFANSKSSVLNRSLKASGFQKNSIIESLLFTKDNTLLTIVSLYSGTPPFDFGVIDTQTGILTPGAQLGLPEISPRDRLSNLAQSPDGKIYATGLGGEGSVVLVQLDLVNKTTLTGRGKIIKLFPLSFNGKGLGNDVFSLAFSPSGQLFALADPQYQGTNSLYTVDLQSGNLTFVRQFAVAKITFIPS